GKPSSHFWCDRYLQFRAFLTTLDQVPHACSAAQVGAIEYFSKESLLCSYNDTSSRTGKLIMGILALIAEFENDIRRERQQDGINKAKAEGVRFGPKPLLTSKVVKTIKELRANGATVAEIIRRTKLSKASVYRALSA